MANARKKNAIFVDATGDITVDAIKPVLSGVLVTPSAANSEFKLKESGGSGVVVVHIKLENVESRYLDFSWFSEVHGIELTTTFNIATLTNISSVILYGCWKAATEKVMGQ